MEESMKLKRILACLFIMAAFPLLALTSHNNSAPFASVAFAGHSLMGGYACTCGCASCICDPGEHAMECSQRSSPPSDNTGKGANQDASPVGAAPTSDLDFGSS